jgi:hypothetical protein
VSDLQGSGMKKEVIIPRLGSSDESDEVKISLVKAQRR